MRPDKSPRADNHALTDYTQRTHVCSRVNTRAVGNNRRRMDARGTVRPGMEHSGDSSVRGVGISADQCVRRAIRCCRFIQDDSTRPRLRQLGFIARVGEKRERVRIRTRQRRHMFYERIGIAAQFAPEPNGEFPKGDRHKISNRVSDKGASMGPDAHCPFGFGIAGAAEVFPAAGACDCRAVRIAGVMSRLGVE
jgi:hypothetical protein